MKRVALLALCLSALLTVSVGSVRAGSRLPARFFLPVLIYHHVKWNKPSDNAIERGLTVYPTQFVAELQYLRGHRYHVITAARLVRSLRQDRALPRRAVVLTFDDGYRDVFPNVYRVLRRFHMPGTFFIVPGFLGTPRYLSWSQVADMSRHGMDIEAHTMTHPDLSTLKPREAWLQILESRRVLQARLHRSVHVFAYPYGSYSSSVVSQVRRAGYWGAFTTHHGLQDRSGLFLEPRVYVNHAEPLSAFSAGLQG